MANSAYWAATMITINKGFTLTSELVLRSQIIKNSASEKFIAETLSRSTAFPVPEAQVNSSLIILHC